MAEGEVNELAGRRWAESIIIIDDIHYEILPRWKGAFLKASDGGLQQRVSWALCGKKRQFVWHEAQPSSLSFGRLG